MSNVTLVQLMGYVHLWCNYNDISTDISRISLTLFQYKVWENVEECY